MNYGYYQPEMGGMSLGCPTQAMPGMPGPMPMPGMPGPMPMPGMPGPMPTPGIGQYQPDAMQLNQLTRRVNRLEQQVRVLDTRVSRLEAMTQDAPGYQQPYQNAQNIDIPMPESTYPSNMHMM